MSADSGDSGPVINVPLSSSWLPTRNTSPLTRRVPSWFVQLSAAHAHFCAAPATCPGLRPLDSLLADAAYAPRATSCLQCVEAEDLLHSIYFGFAVLPPSLTPEDVPPISVPNYPATAAHEEFVWSSIEDDLAGGLIVEVESPPRWLHPLYVRETPEKLRLISDFKVPIGASVNSVADCRKFRMMGLEDAYALLRPHCYMAKVDVSSAFRTVGVRPDHWELLGFSWVSPPRCRRRRRFFVDTRFPFGLTCSPEIFCRISQAVRAMMAALGHWACVVYVDDFLVVGDSQSACQAALDALLRLLAELGFTVNPKKTVLPSQSLVFLGLQLSSNVDGSGAMSVSVPPDKLHKTRALAAQLRSQRVVTLRDLQSAVGYFQHVARAIFSARAFLRRLVDAIVLAERSGSRSVTVTGAMRADLEFWLRFAERFNGTAVVLERPVMDEGFLATDASGSCKLGMGGFYAGRLFAVRWSHIQRASATLPEETRRYNRRRLWPSASAPGRDWIPYREMFAVWWALLKWGARHFRGKTITIHCDNQIVVDDLIKMRARQPELMSLLRAIFRFCADFNIRIRVTWLSSEMNALADALSRMRFDTYTALRARWQETVPPFQEWKPRVFSNPPMLEQKARSLQATSAVLPATSA